MRVSALRYCSGMFDVTLTPNTLPASRETARRRMERALGDAGKRPLRAAVFRWQG
jgi:hypothetical protein